LIYLVVDFSSAGPPVLLYFYSVNRVQIFTTKCQHLVASEASLKQLSSEKHAVVLNCGCKIQTKCAGVINDHRKMCCFISITVINRSCGFASKEICSLS